MDPAHNLEVFTVACKYCHEIVIIHAAHLAVAETSVMRQHLLCCRVLSADPEIADSLKLPVDPLAHFAVFRVGVARGR